MCPPALPAVGAALASMSASTMFAVSLGVSALTGAAQYMGQMQQAEMQADMQTANLQATRDAAASSQYQQDAALHAREDQTRRAAATEIDNTEESALRAQATALASSESAGLSLEALMADFDRQYGNYADSRFQQLGFDMEQIERQRQGVHAQAQSRVNTVPRTPISTPSLWGTAASIGSSAFNAYDTYSTIDPSTGYRTLT